jgi:ABC-2 type transport system permease protein
MKSLSYLFGIAFKDMLRSYRSAFAVVFMFGIPILVTAMFYFIFPQDVDGAAFQMSPVKVVAANLDEGSPEFTQSLQALRQSGGGESDLDLRLVKTEGDLLVQTLTSPGLADLLDVSMLQTAAQAQQAVDEQQAGVAVIIPPDFTQALLSGSASTVVELYHDPALTVGPQIVSSIVSAMVEDAMRAPLGLRVIAGELQAQGLALPSEQYPQLAFQLASAGHQASPEIVQEFTQASEGEPAPSMLLTVLTGIMGGMMIMYAFFTGANSAQSILEEQEKGTLQRIFTTPVPASLVLGGKFLAGGLTVLVQVIVLMLFGSLVFGISWGEPWRAALVGLGITLVAVSFGLFLISLMRDTKQAGFVFGGALTVTGMLGIFSSFTFGSPSASAIMEKIALVVPQGWAMAALRHAGEGAELSQFLPMLLGMLAWSAVFMTIGILRFKRRFA